MKIRSNIFYDAGFLVMREMSSVLAFECAVRDVLAVHLVREMDCINTRVRLLHGSAHVCRLSDNAEHASAGRDDLAVLRCRAGTRVWTKAEK